MTTLEKPATAARSEPSELDRIGASLRGLWRRHPQRSLETLGRQVDLGRDALIQLIVSIARRRFPYREFIKQCAFMTSVSAAPTVLVAIPIAVVVSIQVGALVNQVGATTFIGAVAGLGIIRQGAPLVTSLMIAGAVGSAITADLGSRTIREEIDAMMVMGVDPVRRLVAPRLAAAVLVSMLLCGFIVFVGFATAYMFNVYAQSGTPGSFIGSFASFAVANDLVIAVLKAAVFGLLTAVIACDIGLHAHGGPGGVANAVNSAVVSSALMLFATNIVLTQLYNTLLPTKVV
ncbi:MlaE family ABC transporter permease [Nocardia seriolae]|uniref:Phospholipid ABC transporter permease protein MlaE n=1 Tax=Nocardia seriolae TaxID=37332 RepID=A0ABC8AWV5_9NOCA|nr:ABC transporter permease [Nocardia seriolae]APA98479.1 putative phospholipid ABC transporter permease protein MlaE [Nocardia seriolae]MTJ64063.1 ABC transporter permease [Nocardia seriolae]MTJ74357.1 ABC transporter permease [Nocardia seriolae]MTJ88158.1 ABC transporter permease [Nocardia seriolae]MTK32147.1 ABC transporter permease [Nocardia seriolae]